jgi:serine/threonine protein kinase
MPLPMRHPTRFGKYLLLERIAVGGMAEVFVAKAFGVEGFERLVAIKKILPTMGEDAEFIRMFVDEARIAAQLAHANIVQVLELGKHDESLYIAMEYVSGRDLRQLMERFRKRQEPMPLPQVCLIVAEVCEALDHAHRKRDARGRALGIVHRDVSPQNVLVSFEGEVKLIDFGIAKAESRLQKTQSGILKGKFSYMSPEQVKGGAVDGRSDVFACGILLWELVCGEKLFVGDSDYAVLEKVRLGAIPPPRSRNPRCPEALERAILKALAIEPARRYQTASELHDDLVRFTVASGAVFGARQLAAWLRSEFQAEYESEQQRLRAWLAVSAPPSREPVRPEPSVRSELPAVIVADLTQTPRAPVAAPADPHELPTIQVDDAALAVAQTGQFDVGDDRTAAPRSMRSSALTRSLREQGGRANARRWALYAAVPVALGVAAVSYVIGQREPLPGKVIVTPTPPVAADLIIDGRPSGQLPPFVHTLSPGTHRIELRAEGYKPFAATVQIAQGGAPLELNANLEAERPLQIQGVVLTQAPAAESPPAAPPPRNRPSSRKPQRPSPPAAPVEPVVTAPPPQLSASTPVVPPSIGYLVVQTKPATRLTIDGRDTGRWTPVPAANPIALPAGNHTLLFESADGRRHEEQVEIEAGKTARFVRSLP